MVIAALPDRAESFTQFLTVILVFVFVLGLTYLTTRFVGSYQKTKSAGRNFEVIETYKITNGKYLQIVRVGEKYVVIGIGKDSITSICELSAEDIKEAAEPKVADFSFGSILDKAEAVSKKAITIMRNRGSIGGRRGLVIFCFLAYFLTFFFMSPTKVYASEVNELGITTESEPRTPTVIREPGTATDASDISELNVSNNLSITYTDEQGNLSGTLRILIILTLIAMAPFLVIMMTSFTRILIVLHFVRAAIGTQTAPPNQVLVGLTLFLTFFIMNPVITDINNNAVKPFEAGEIQQEEFMDAALQPLREFMYPQTQTKDVRLFMDIAKM